MSNAAPTSRQQDTPPAQFNDILLEINFSDVQEIAKKETGLRIAERIFTDQTSNSGSLNFFTARAARYLTIEHWAKGTQDMTEFLDFFNVSDGNKAYVKIDMSPVMVGPQFVGTLVDSMCKTEEYPCVKAVDEDSLEEKEQRKIDALFRMRQVETINDMQQQSGVQLEPTGAYVPDDELSAQVYFELEDQLPKEIKFEKLLEKSLLYNQYEKSLKRKFIYDLIVNNLECNKIEIDIYGNKTIRKSVPKNVIYNFFMGDTGRLELKYIGEVYNMKICDIRIKYGKSEKHPEGLSEKNLYDLARYSNTINTGLGFAWPWQPQYMTYDNRRPWDDYSVYIFDFEIRIEEKEYYTNRVDSFGKDNITPKKGKPEPTGEKTKVLSKEKIRWYNGIYAPYAKQIIYWGLPDLIIFPYTDVYRGLSSYTINIPFNNGEYVPSLFERALEPLREYALTKLKRKQLIAKLRPSGIRIDVESARNVDLGSGDTIPWTEIVRIFDQTGNELWSSRGINPNEKEMPALTATAADDTIMKIVNLTKVLESCLMDIRALLGVPMYRDGSDLPERTSGKQAELQNASSFNVTDFIENAHNQFMQETLYKLCLLDWQKIVKEEPESKNDLINTRFDVSVKMKMSEYQKELLQQKINVAMQTIDQSTGKPLLSFKDAFRIEQIDNFKLAYNYLVNQIQENERKAEQDKQNREQANIQSQQQSAVLAKQEEAKIKREQMDADKEMEEFKATKQKEIKLLEGFFQAAAKDESGQLIMKFMPAIQQLVPNITIPLAKENKDMVQQDQVEQLQEQMAAQQQQGIPSQEEVGEQQMQPQMQ